MDQHTWGAASAVDTTVPAGYGRRAGPPCVSLHQLVDEVVEDVRSRASEQGLAVEVRHDLRPRIVQVEPEWLRRAVTRLLLNALVYTRADRPLLVWTFFSPNFIEIGVRNAAGHLGSQTALAPASAVYGSAKAMALGFDMALARNFVELQGGHIGVRAAARHGAPATLLIRLPPEVATPLAAPVPRRERTSGLDPKTRLDGTHVLLVEDDPDALEFLTLILCAAGARVSGFTYAAPAFTFFVNAAPENRPDVIVSDIAMPIEDGYSFLRRLRSWEAEQATLPVPAIAVTAFSRDEDCQRALTSGFDRHVSKPIDAAKLLATIAQWA